MAAIFEWSESNGAGETVTDDIANINFGSIDAPELNTTTYTIVRNTNSYAKYIRGRFTIGSGESALISNMKFWKSLGNYKLGETISAGFNVTYEQPSTIDMRETPYLDDPVPTSEPVQNVNSFEGESTIDCGVSGVSGYTGYIRLQLQTDIQPPAGLVNTKTFVFQYDEV